MTLRPGNKQTPTTDRGVKKAIATVLANDPNRVKDKTAANERIKQFAGWLNDFKREDYRKLSTDSLESLRQVVGDTVKILEGLQSVTPAEINENDS